MSAQERTRIARQDKLRLYVLIIALFAVVGVMWHFSTRSTEPDKGVVVRPEGIGQPLTPEPDEPPLPAPGVTEPGPTQGPALPPKRPDVLPAVSMEPDPPEPRQWQAAEVEALLAKVKDSATSIDPDALAYCLHRVRTTAHDDPQRMGAPWCLQGDLESASDDLRGKWVQIIGNVSIAMIYEPEGVPKSGPSGVYQMYETFVFDANGKAIKVISVHNTPPIEQRAAVQLTGIYLQVHAYQNDELDWVGVPVVVTDRIEPHESEEAPASVWMQYVLPVVLAVAGVALVVVLVAGGTKGFGRGRRPIVRARPAEAEDPS